MPADSRLCAHDVEHRRALAGERRCLHVAAGWAVQSTGVQAATLLQQLLGGRLQLSLLLRPGCCSWDAVAAFLRRVSPRQQSELMPSARRQQHGQLSNPPAHHSIAHGS